MMKLTREEAIANHRKMWNWIADETERVRRCVDPIEYFREHGDEIPENHNYCCEYDLESTCVDWCEACPLDIPKDQSCIPSQTYGWRRYAQLARITANFPERKE